MACSRTAVQLRPSPHSAIPTLGVQVPRHCRRHPPPLSAGGCGSCWAFSATEALESAAALASGKAAPVLAPQQLVSCSPNPKHCGGTGGCDGSTQELAFQYTEG